MTIDNINHPDYIKTVKDGLRTGNWEELIEMSVASSIPAESLDKLLTYCINLRMPVAVADEIWERRKDEPENRRSHGEREGDGF